MNRYGWLGIVIGIWLIIAPFVLGYSRVVNAMWNDIIIGILVAVVSYLANPELRGAKVGDGGENK
ncbi:SPW repeat protein [Desulfofundulus sp.]|uniref:SPW repeat protein n=1 Tax=Desulfofundulus sp. TaxID=2282750 RepID=UPI003C78C75D